MALFQSFHCHDYVAVFVKHDGHVHRLFRKVNGKFEDIGGKTDPADTSAGKAGIATWTAGKNNDNQLIHAIFNKDAYPSWCPQGVFAGAMTNDPEAVQAGPVIEKLIGKGYYQNDYLEWDSNNNIR